jgi:hypothetical protein
MIKLKRPKSNPKVLMVMLLLCDADIVGQKEQPMKFVTLASGHALRREGSQLESHRVLHGGADSRSFFEYFKLKSKHSLKITIHFFKSVHEKHFFIILFLNALVSEKVFE